jgi:hypothetical protein
MAHPVVPVPPSGDEAKAGVDEAGGEGDCAGKASVKGEKERSRKEKAHQHLHRRGS